MPEVKMIMAGCELKKAIVCREVLVRVADDQIARANIRRRHSESYELTCTRSYTAFLYAAKFWE